MLNNHDKNIVLKALNELAEHYDYNLAAKKSVDYFECLKYFKLTAVLKAIHRGKAATDFFPSLNKLETLAEKFDQEVREAAPLPKEDCSRCMNSGMIEVISLDSHPNSPRSAFPYPLNKRHDFPPETYPQAEFSIARCGCAWGSRLNALQEWTGPVEGVSEQNQSKQKFDMGPLEDLAAERRF